jgi:hypothetical protein
VALEEQTPRQASIAADTILALLDSDPDQGLAMLRVSSSLTELLCDRTLKMSCRKASAFLIQAWWLVLSGWEQNLTISNHFLCSHAGKNQALGSGRAARRLQFGVLRSNEFWCTVLPVLGRRPTPLPAPEEVPAPLDQPKLFRSFTLPLIDFPYRLLLPQAEEICSSLPIGARGEMTSQSDLDNLVTPSPTATRRDLLVMAAKLKDAVGRKVDISSFSARGGQTADLSSNQELRGCA